MAKLSPSTRRRANLAAALSAALLAAACGNAPPAGSDATVVAAAGQPPVKHVFIIMLENKEYSTTFGPNSPAPYFADSMTARGALLTHYYGTGHFSLDNYISLISGQAPDSATQSDCHEFVDFVQTGTAAYGQAVGAGCVYPSNVHTIADQLEAAGFSWKGYMEDMGRDPSREADRCGHVAIGAVDVTNTASKADQYADKHNPFIYFHSVIDDTASCRAHVVPLEQLAQDLQSVSTTPNYSFITPGLCHDGHNTPCITGEPGGLVSADEFLAHWVPLITQSPAFQKDGLLMVTFDEATGKDVSACCNEQPGPNAAMPGLAGPGGGRIGAVLISPFIRPGTVSDPPYNHYAALRSFEDMFGLSHLGFAAQEGLATFGHDVFTNTAVATTGS